MSRPTGPASSCRSGSGAYRIAMVGAGATAVSLLKTFVDERAGAGSRARLHITLFERGRLAGPGMPYQEDAPSLLLNRPAQDMSCVTDDPGHFVRWLVARSGAPRESLAGAFIPRRLFGEYLRDTLEETGARAAELGIEVRVVPEEVVDIQRAGVNLEILTRRGTSCPAHALVLCTGNTRPRDVYGLSGTPRYLHTPYPLEESLAVIGASDRVAIIGSSLTAIDVAVTLQHRRHRGPITLCSRGGRLPTVRGVDGPYAPKHLTHAAVEREAAHTGAVSLKFLVKALRRELAEVGADWREVFFPSERPSDLASALAADLERSAAGSRWFDVLRETHPTLDHAWRYVRDEEKRRFSERYLSTYLSRRAAVPAVNATRLHAMAAAGQLELIRDLRAIKAQSETGIVLQHGPEGARRTFDWVINATGPARGIEEAADDALMPRLVRNGLAVPHPSGGIRVDFDTGAVLGEDRAPNPRLRALGHMTAGTYFIVNNLEFIARLARRISADLSAQVNASTRATRVTAASAA